MKQIDDITLIKVLGAGGFGEVYLSTKKGKNGYFATKRIDRLTADQPNTFKYIKSELDLLKNLNHPNIVKLEDFKYTKDNYYIVMEYINGGGLDKCLQKYIKKYRKPFSEEIVQYLMRQIVDAIKYIHSLNIIHRDIKSENIMVNFKNESDKANLNMMRAQIKIIDFGFSCIKKKGLVYTAVGNPQGMDPLILKKYLGIKKQSDGYDEKVDIWSLGALCYELLFGQPIFDATSLDELDDKIENGIYIIPTSVSREIVSFLNGMLQYDGKNRYTAEELANHPFLKTRVQGFHKIDLHRVSKKVKNGNLNINIKENKTIWELFNEADKKLLLSVAPIRINDYTNRNNLNPINASMKPINESIISNKTNFQNYIPPGGRNLYGISMFPSESQSQVSMSQSVSNSGNKMNNNISINYPTFNIPTNDMSKYLNINNSNAIPQNNIPYQNQMSQNINHSNYIPANNHIVNEDEKDSGCNIY